MNQTRSNRPSLVIQAGIAGCWTRKRAGEVVVVGEEVLGDLGVWEKDHFRSLFDLQLQDEDGMPFSGGRLLNPYRQLLALTGLKIVRGVTVNEISTDPGRITWHQQNTSAVVESMEGGALHYVCLREEIPFIQFRSISNDVGIRDKTKWDIPLAIRRLNEELISFLEKVDPADQAIFKK